MVEPDLQEKGGRGSRRGFSRRNPLEFARAGSCGPRWGIAIATRSVTRLHARWPVVVAGRHRVRHAVHVAGSERVGHRLGGAACEGDVDADSADFVKRRGPRAPRRRTRWLGRAATSALATAVIAVVSPMLATLKK